VPMLRSTRMTMTGHISVPFVTKLSRPYVPSSPTTGSVTQIEPRPNAPCAARMCLLSTWKRMPLSTQMKRSTCVKSAVNNLPDTITWLYMSKFTREKNRTRAPTLDVPHRFCNSPIWCHTWEQCTDQPRSARSIAQFVGRQSCGKTWNFIQDYILENEITNVCTAEGGLPYASTWLIMWKLTLAKNRKSAKSVTTHSTVALIWRPTKWLTLTRDHTDVQTAQNDLSTRSLWNDIQKLADSTRKHWLVAPQWNAWEQM
jgi:hypothetical protein